MALDVSREAWYGEKLSLVVFGASGDLAQLKTFPAIFDLFLRKMLPEQCVICGYARSKKTDDEFRAKIRPNLLKKTSDESKVNEFLSLCIYKQSKYDSAELLNKAMEEVGAVLRIEEGEVDNRIYYLAIPPAAFADAVTTIKEGGVSPTGYTRIIIEKPFGTDSASAKTLQQKLGGLFDESHYYRIDHYLGKEMIQNVLFLRLGNIFLEPLWNSKSIESVLFNFDEDFGTFGRGGYFDDAGMIRDVMQNHVMQLVALLCMEPPAAVTGKAATEAIRDAKVKVLKKVEAWKFSDTILGQYKSNGDKPGYLDDDTVPNGSTTETFACVNFKINNKRWKGVNFVMKAGKALNKVGTEVRVLFKDTMNTGKTFQTSEPLARNELIIRCNYGEKISMRMNVKAPGLTSETIPASMVLDYDRDITDMDSVQAYTRLILDVLRGNQANFVRADEVEAAWKIVTPLLHKIEGGDDVKPTIYEFGSHGPDEAYNMIREMGFDI